MPQVDESVTKEHIGKSQGDFLDWLQDKLEDEMKKSSYKHYVEQEELNSNKAFCSIRRGN
jgi:hypothetical protein